MEVNIYEAKTHLSRLIEKALAGEEVVIARAGKPLVRLNPIGALKPVLGGAASEYPLPDDWDSPEANLEVEKLFLGD